MSSAEEALELIARWKPDVLVSDIGMTTQNGHDLIRAVRGLVSGESARIPALALSGYAGPEHSRLARGAGFQLHLSKPVEPAALALAIARLAGRMQAA